MEPLAGKAAIVTGAGRGIGQRTAVRLAQLKVITVLISRTEIQLMELARLPLISSPGTSRRKLQEAV